MHVCYDKKTLVSPVWKLNDLHGRSANYDTFSSKLKKHKQKIKSKQLQHHTFPKTKTPTDTKFDKTVQNTKLAAASRYKNHSGQCDHRGHCCVMAVCGARVGSQNSAAPLD